MRYIVVIFLLIRLLPGCAENVAEGTVDTDKETMAKSALDNFEFDQAIELYGELIAENPTRFEFLALSATAYAGRAGVDILSIASNKLTGEGSLIAKVGQFVPEDPTDEQLADIATAVDQLETIPIDEVDDSLRLSVIVQLSIYLTVNSTMLINSFTSLTPTGQLDPETLDQMTPEDAAEILASLESAAATTEDPKLKAKLEGVLAEIDAAEGADREEKLKGYLQTQ